MQQQLPALGTAGDQRVCGSGYISGSAVVVRIRMVEAVIAIETLPTIPQPQLVHHHAILVGEDGRGGWRGAQAKADI